MGAQVGNKERGQQNGVFVGKLDFVDFLFSAT
jgi:hypothetical protein